MGIMSKGEKIEQVILHIIFIIMCLAVVVPFLLLFMSSITDENELITYGYNLFPKKISFDAYIYIFSKSGAVIKAYGVSLFITFIGTALSLIITPMLAYPLSRPEFKYRNIIAFMVFFTMLFNGGLVSYYMVWTRIFHINDTIWSLIFPGLLVNAFNIILVKNFFSANIPNELLESARMDGAGEFKIFLRIVFPLSKAIMATIGLFVAIAYWNDWTNGLYFIKKKTELFSLQNYLNRILYDIQFLSSSANTAATFTQNVTMPTTAVRMALAAVGVVPIMILYPFFQKYFEKGITIGAVKG